jgi:hypothetical protein
MDCIAQGQGAASLLANAKDFDGAPLVPVRLQEKHGRWAPGSTARVGYIEDDENAKALVPSILSI